MKKLLLIVLLVCIKQLNAQTNVSGGIYTNTTWSLSSSPYIVVDTVVVFPGVTLTIQPGVIVKFDNNKRIEVRHKLIAQGTITDSITFTSNSGSPTPGIWSSIFLNTASATADTFMFAYCKFKYAGTAINGNFSSDIIKIKRSNFTQNVYCISNSYGLIDSSNFLNNYCGSVGGGIINYCNFKNNTYGLYSGGGTVTHSNISKNQVGWEQCGGSNISNCVIDSNQIGIEEFRWSTIKNSTISHNQIGMSDAIEGENYITYCNIDSNSQIGILNQGSTPDSIYRCNIRANGIGIDIQYDAIVVCNNISNDSIGIRLAQSTSTILDNSICNNSPYGLQYTNSANTNILRYNYWCTLDSTSTEPLIYDGYDNINYGLVHFMPFDSSCYHFTKINQIKNSIVVSIYPNPTSDQFFIDANTTDKLNVDLYDVNGRQVFSASVMDKSNLNVSSLNEGIYTLTIKTADRVTNKKVVILR